MILAFLERLSAVHGNHKRIASGAMTIGLLVLVAKLFGAAREVAIAWRYGISGVVDAYQLALTVTTWLPVMLTGVMTVVFVPRLVALRQRGTDCMLFVRELNGSVLLLSLAVMALTWLVGPAAAAELAGGLEPRVVSLASAMTAEMAPVALFIVFAGYLSARLQSRERFTYSATEALPALAIAVLVFGPWGEGKAAPLIWGTVVGYLAQLIVLLLMTRKGDAPLGVIRLRHSSPEWGTLYQAIFVMAAGQVVLALTVPIDQAFAARLGEGAVATMGYANRMVSLITGFGAVVLARALLPVLSVASAAGDHALGSRQTQQWAGLLFGGGLVVVAVGWLMAPVAVTIVFERGAFTSSDTAVVTRVLRFGLLQLPFYFSGIALVQWIAASGRYGVLLSAACLALGTKIIMNVLLVSSFGLAGLMAATAGMYASSVALQYIVVAKKNA